MCWAQVKDQSNSAYALRQIYQKHLQPYEQYCAEEEAAEAKRKSGPPPGPPATLIRKGEIGHHMAAQVLGAMLAASAADAKGSGAGLVTIAEEPPKKRRRTEQVNSSHVVGAKRLHLSGTPLRSPGECHLRFRRKQNTRFVNLNGFSPRSWPAE